MAGTVGMRARVVGLAAEAAMVVFAVLVALALEEWRQEQRLLDFADRARASVVAETGANLQELDDTREGLLAMQELLGRVVETEDLAPLADGEFEIVLPDLSSAAWEVAQGSEAAPYFDYEWVIEMARAYEVLEIYANASDNVIGAMSAVIGREPSVEHIAGVFGWLAIINGLHEQAAERLRQVTEEPSS